MEKLLETAQVWLKVGWGRASGNHQGGANSVSQINGDSDVVPTFQLCGSAAVWRGLQKEQWPQPALLSGRKLPPTSHPDVTQFSSSPYVSDSFQSAAPMLEVWVSPSKFVGGPFKRNCLRLQQFLSSTASIPDGFYSQNLWWYLFLALEPWAEGSHVGLGPLLLRYPSWFLSPTCGCGTSLFCVHPSCQSQYGFFFNLIIVGPPFSLISDSSEWWLFYSLVVILMWFCKVSHVYLCLLLAQKSIMEF